MKMDIAPLTPERWPDLEQLFGPRGAYGGCWCMWNRLTNREFEATSGDEKREMLRSILDDRVPGLLAYKDGLPIGWVSLGPREEFGRIQRSRVTKAFDDVPVWSIVCFMIDRHHRGSGVGTALLEAAVAYARAHGARAIEGLSGRAAQRAHARYLRLDGAGLDVRGGRIQRDCPAQRDQAAVSQRVALTWSDRRRPSRPRPGRPAAASAQPALPGSRSPVAPYHSRKSSLCVVVGTYHDRRR